MAIQTEFIDFIVSINAIRAKYPGGLEACLKDHARLIGGLTLPCDWLVSNGPSSVAHIDDPGSAVVGRGPEMFNQ